jgi:hypothetical protein
MTDAYLYIHLWLLYNIQAAYFEAEYIFLSFNLIECFPASNHYKVLIYSKKPTLYGFCTKPTKSALKSLENSILGFGLFSELFRTFIPGCLCISSQNAFWRVRIVFLRFGIYGNTKKISLFDTQKLPKIQEFFAWNLFCNIDMCMCYNIDPNDFFSKNSNF